LHAVVGILLMRESTVFYRSFYEAIKELDADTQAQVYSAIFEYALNFNEVEVKGVAKTVFTLIKPQLDANLKRYENGTKAKVKQVVTKQEAKPKQTISKVEANVNVNVNDNVNVNENENVNHNQNDNVSRSRFRAPTYDEIFDFMKSKNALAGNVWPDAKVLTEAKAFFNHYESNGWMVGKNKMKNWEAAVRNWMNNNSKFENNKSKNIIQNEREKRASDLEKLRQQYRSSIATNFNVEDITSTE
jgi:hypothetical protein